MQRFVTFLLNLIGWLLSFVPGTKAYAYRKAREAFTARVDAFTASVQKRYPGATVDRLAAQGTFRSPQRSIRRVYAQMWSRAFNDWPLSARQWVRLRKAQKAGGVVRGRAAHVTYFLNGGDVKPRKAVA